MLVADVIKLPLDNVLHKYSMSIASLGCYRLKTLSSYVRGKKNTGSLKNSPWGCEARMASVPSQSNLTYRKLFINLTQILLRIFLKMCLAGPRSFLNIFSLLSIHYRTSSSYTFLK